MTGFSSVFRPDLFAGRRIVVSGSGSGIGRCVAHELATLGAHVVLVGRDEDKLRRVQAELREGASTVQLCDIREEDQVEALFSALEADGGFQGVVNNAGGQFVSPAASISRRGFEAVVRTNLIGTFLMCKSAYHHGLAAEGGAIVNMLVDNHRGMPMMAHSGAARAGVENLTRTLALEWAEDHIRVNAVAPGIIASSGLENYPEAVQEALRQLPRELPLGRFGTEAEVSSAIVFLLSDAARYITGATLRVDGASSLYRHPFTLGARTPAPAHRGFDPDPDGG